MSYADRCRAYSAAKDLWLVQHPTATPEQIEAAFRAIAQRLGV